MIIPESSLRELEAQKIGMWRRETFIVGVDCAYPTSFRPERNLSCFLIFLYIFYVIWPIALLIRYEYDQRISII